MNKEWFAMKHDSRLAVIVNADGLHDARLKASAFLGPETAPHQIGVTPRPRAAFDRFPDMKAGIIFSVPAFR